MKQSLAFMLGEGDRYHERNRGAIVKKSVVNAILGIGIKPKSILEVGCGDARYLHELYGYYSCLCVGIDPSASAIREASDKYPELELYRGTAEEMYGFHDNKFDLIIFGFCLYLADRDQLFHIVANADGCLREGGFIAIHDFDPEYPQIVAYHHKPGLNSYKMDYSSLWLANPAYQKLSKTKTEEGEAITIIQKRCWDLTSG
jgi:ubiquinone/menaquinone biosynthesis C-methylase UbiE